MEQRSNVYKSYGNWLLKRQLGSGGFGVVLHWVNLNTKREIATKSLQLHKTLGRDELQKLRERWRQEYEWMLQLNKDFFVRGIEIKDDPDFVTYLNDRHSFRPLPVIIMEYCNGGDVRAQLRRPENVNGLPESQVREILKMLRNAIAFLHNERQICHRDLKPDNIVIVQEGSRKIYKLTDFGFAREAAMHTTKQSVVGTIHYFAPEVIDTAKYTRSVDYWSLGIIAYELICGHVPFLPHQSQYVIINKIREKSYDCIAITEKPSTKEHSFNMERTLPMEQHCSGIFRIKMEQWLPLALDQNRKTRGYRKLSDIRDATDEVQQFGNAVEQRIPDIFTDLDAILATQVLTAYCPNTYRFYAFEINAQMEMEQFFTEVITQCGIRREQIYFVLPTGHPHKLITYETRPIDLYVDDWQNMSDSSNPQVMLYIFGYQCEYNASDPDISETLRYCASEIGNTTEHPAWLLKTIIKQTHFLLSNEQLQVVMLLNSLQEYAMIINHEMFLYGRNVETLLANCIFSHGQMNHFNMMISQAKEVNERRLNNGDVFFKNWMSTFLNHSERIQQIQQLIAKVKIRYDSSLHRSKDAANSKLYAELINSDIYKLDDFRSKMSSKDDSLDWDSCISAFYECLKKRKEFLENQNLKKLKDCISTVHSEFTLIKQTEKSAQTLLNNINSDLNAITKEFFEKLATTPQRPLKRSLTESMQSLKIDTDSASLTSTLANGHDQSASIYDGTNELIYNALRIEELMFIDLEQEIPLTVSQSN